MKADNPLSQGYMLQYPLDSARTLEQISASHVASLFEALPEESVVPVISAMLPKSAAACVEAMVVPSAARLLDEMPVAAASRLFRQLESASQRELLKYLPEKKHAQLSRYLVYPSSSAGAMVDSDIDTLPENMTVGEAIKYLKKIDHPVRYGIYIVNEQYQLRGIVDPGVLLISDTHEKLKNVMLHKVQSISAHIDYEKLLEHPGWGKHRRLPVLERDNTLLGVLHHSQLQDALAETVIRAEIDSAEGLFYLANFFWIGLNQLLESILFFDIKKRER